MNTSKLKAIFATVCCFVFALCSEIKSMDTASDLQETTSYKAKITNSESCLDSLETEMDSNSSCKRLLLNQDENKTSQTSWKSYISQTVQATINGVYSIGACAIKHPTQTMMVSLVVASQLTAVAAYCNCILYDAWHDEVTLPQADGSRIIIGPAGHDRCEQIVDATRVLSPLLSLGLFPSAEACAALNRTFIRYCFVGCFG